MDNFEKEWSGRRDSNPCLDLGKVPYYPYTTAAQINKTLTRRCFGDKNREAHNEPTASGAGSLYNRA